MPGSASYTKSWAVACKFLNITFAKIIKTWFILQILYTLDLSGKFTASVKFTARSILGPRPNYYYKLANETNLAIGAHSNIQNVTLAATVSQKREAGFVLEWRW